HSVTVNGGSGANLYNVFDTRAVNDTTLNTGNGNDVVSVRGTQRPLIINGGTGGVVVKFSAPVRNLDAFRGDVTVNGSSAGFNAWPLKYKAHAANTGFLVNASMVVVSFTPAAFRFNRINALTINGGNASFGNTFNVQSTAANTAVTIHAGGGNDTIN